MTPTIEAHPERDENRDCGEHSRQPMMRQLLVWRGHPAGDMGAGVEAELVQDAANVALDGTLGYEQAGTDLLVAQAVGDQPGDLLFSLAEQPRRPRLRRLDGSPA